MPNTNVTTTTTTVKPENKSTKVKAQVYLKYKTQRYAIGQIFEIDNTDLDLVKNNLVSVVK